MAIDPLSHGIAVERAYFLLNKEGKKERQLNSGDTVPRGSYIESLVVATHENEERMQFVLVENPKPACCEILPETDQRYDQTSTGFALREDKTQGVAYHHEQSGKELKDRCVLHAELAGKFMIPPARAELMYNTLEYGHSDAFVLNVE